MDRIFSEIDYRIINFMADNGREPNLGRAFTVATETM
jgi:hypothetical protein